MTISDSFERLRLAVDEQACGTSDHDLNKSLKAMHQGCLIEASVLVPVLRGRNVPGIVLTKRSHRLKHHAGQLSFPGGRLEPEDRSPESAALREAEEEIGLHPGSVEILGQCPAHETATGFRITPFVGLICGDTKFVRQEEEVEEIFEVPLDYAMDPRNYSIEWRQWNGQRRYFRAIVHENRYIWGATAGILYGLASRYSKQCA